MLSRLLGLTNYGSFSINILTLLIVCLQEGETLDMVEAIISALKGELAATTVNAPLF
jgi:hypothetical protein